MLPLEALPQRLALDVCHDVEEETVGFARLDDAEDVRMQQLRGDLDLAQEALTGHGAAELGAQNFDSDLTSMAQVFGEVHRCRCSRANFTFDAVATGEA